MLLTGHLFVDKEVACIPCHPLIRPVPAARSPPPRSRRWRTLCMCRCRGRRPAPAAGGRGRASTFHPRTPPVHSGSLGREQISYCPLWSSTADDSTIALFLNCCCGAPQRTIWVLIDNCFCLLCFNKVYQPKQQVSVPTS